MKFYENIEAERDRIQACIKKYGWTSDHHLDWYIDSIIEEEAKPVFVEFDDGAGLLAHQYSDKWRIWSDPLCDKNLSSQKISEFAGLILKDDIKELWCDDVSDKIYQEIKNAGYKELDMQGDEEGGGLDLKIKFGAKIERKTDTFSIKNRS